MPESFLGSLAEMVCMAPSSFALPVVVGGIVAAILSVVWCEEGRLQRQRASKTTEQGQEIECAVAGWMNMYG